MKLLRRSIPASLADTLPQAPAFARDLRAMTQENGVAPDWLAINRLAAIHFPHPKETGFANPSQLGHALAVELVGRGELEAVLTHTRTGVPMVARLIPRPQCRRRRTKAAA